MVAETMISAFAAILFLLCWLVAVPSFAFIGFRKLFESGSKKPEMDKAMRNLGFLDLGFALLLGTIPFLAPRIAEVSTGWYDPDGDGMLSDLVMGQYDWGDIVLPSAVLWGLGFAVFLIAVRSLLRRKWAQLSSETDL
jgi:hypothetical protein